MVMFQSICKTIVRSSSSSRGNVYAAVKANWPYENSAQYSADGEKIYCGLKFNKEGSRTEEELSMIVETARANAFEDSLKNVAIIKVDP